MKASYYFAHDYHARFDPKLSALIKDFGMRGYGVWWVLVEVMHEQGGKIEKFPKLYSGLAHDFMENEAYMKQIISALIKDFCLLKEDATYIWSNRVTRNIDNLNHKSIQKAAAGRIGGLKSGLKRSTMKQNEAPLEANELNKNKVNKNKVNNTMVGDFFAYYVLKTKKAFKLTEANRELVEKRLSEGYTLEQLKQAVDGFMLDDWPDRGKHLDLIYCIGKQRGKPDALEKWLNWKPTTNFVRV